MDRLKALPGIAELHANAVAAHRARRDALLADPAYRAMQAQLREASPYSAAEAQVRAEIGLK